jgi:hypothetical protein
MEERGVSQFYNPPRISLQREACIYASVHVRMSTCGLWLWGNGKAFTHVMY